MRLEPVPSQILVRRLADHQISWLARLLTTFLDHAKIGRLTSDNLRERVHVYPDRQRGERFLDLFDEVWGRYEQRLANEKALDFHDLINHAESHIREGRWRSPYRYVLVDEFQDIAAGRMALLRSLKRSEVAYFLVGDDWQSIYRFAGSDVGLVQECGTYLGHVQEIELGQTFRFGNGILGPSTEFVKRNRDQTQRPLRSAGVDKDDGITVVAGRDPVMGLTWALGDIQKDTEDEQCDVLGLGRYRHSRKALSKATRAEFSTVHGAKGREADYVIVLDLKDSTHGLSIQDRRRLAAGTRAAPCYGQVLPVRRGAPFVLRGHDTGALRRIPCHRLSQAVDLRRRIDEGVTRSSAGRRVGTGVSPLLKWPVGAFPEPQEPQVLQFPILRAPGASLSQLHDGLRGGRG